MTLGLSVTMWGQGWHDKDTDRKGAWETFCCDGNVPQVGWDCDYTPVYIYQNVYTLNCTLKMGVFYYM